MLALIFLTIFGGLLVSITRFNSNEVRRNEADVAAWELVEISKAARLYARDQAVNPAYKATLATSPQVITVATLRAGGYLTRGFGRTRGGVELNALNQPIHIVIANWSTQGLAGPAADPNTVPGAFVYFEPGGKADASLMVDVVDRARSYGAALTAPQFAAGSGANASARCRDNAPSAGLWDTGCLTQGEFAFLAGVMGVNATLTPGGLIMPAWKAYQPDLRVVMRYPQPENPGYATMLTDLQMAVPAGDCTNPNFQIRTTRVEVDSGGDTTTTFDPIQVCDTVDDGLTNRRFDINNIATMRAQRLVGDPQATDFGGADATQLGNQDVMRINGTATLGSDLRIYNTLPMPTAGGVTNRLSVLGPLTIERNAYTYSRNIANRGVARVETDATANALVSDNMSAGRFTSMQGGSSGAPAQIDIDNRTTIAGATQVSNGMGPGDNSELTADIIRGSRPDGSSNAVLYAHDNTGQVQVTGVMHMSGSSFNVGGNQSVPGPDGTPYTALVGEIADAGEVRVEGIGGDTGTDFRFLPGSPSNIKTVGVAGTAPGTKVHEIGTTGRCVEGRLVAGGCAERQYFPPDIRD